MGLSVRAAASAPLADFIAQMGKSIAAGDGGRCGDVPQLRPDPRRLQAHRAAGVRRCYATFDVSLRGLLRKLHGGTQHSGKVYLPPDPSETDRTARSREPAPQPGSDAVESARTSSGPPRCATRSAGSEPAQEE
jgi:hypothetical protein